MTQESFGLMAMFETVEALRLAVRRTREAGYRDIDAYTPFPVEGLPEELGVQGSFIPLIALLCGIAGSIGIYGLLYYAMAVNYPLDVGGRAHNSWPTFIPITFEVAILCGFLGALFAMFWATGLPGPYQSVFNARCFDLASLDRFFLCIKKTDPRFDPAKTRQFLTDLDPVEVSDVAL